MELRELIYLGACSLLGNTLKQQQGIDNDDIEQAIADAKAIWDAMPEESDL